MNDADFDDFRFVIHEMFLYYLDVFLRFERFNAFSYMVDNEFFWEDPRDHNTKMHSNLCAIAMNAFNCGDCRSVQICCASAIKGQVSISSLL